ncbi:MAG: T9SS type A sorting domain-containing protein, partial [Bacteroidia bacterium]
FSIYPNPANDLITINSAELFDSWQLYNSAGQLINSGTGASAQLSISTEALSNGVYMLSIQTASGTAQKSITVRH